MPSSSHFRPHPPPRYGFEAEQYEWRAMVNTRNPTGVCPMAHPSSSQPLNSARLSFPLSSSPVTIELTQVSSTCCPSTRLRKSGGTRSLRCGCRRHRRHRFPVATICSASRKNRWSSRSLSPAPSVLSLPSPSRQRLHRHLRLRQRQRHGRLPLLPLLNE